MAYNDEVDTSSEDPAWARAKAKATAQREFYGHLTIFVLVSALLVIIDIAGGTSGATFLGLDWAYWPIGGWAIGLAIHALRVFGIGTDWEDRRAAKLYEEERRRESQRH
jgi:hypothetical protein